MTKRLLTLALLAGACTFAGCGESDDCAITGSGAKLCGDADISAFCEATQPAIDAANEMAEALADAGDPSALDAVDVPRDGC